LKGEIGAARIKLEGEVGSVRGEVASVRSELKEESKQIRDKISSAMLWAILLYVTLSAGLLGVMARGFHWL
jgi:hypothetical protein